MTENGFNASDVDFQRMLSKLREGDEGRHFGKFVDTDPKRGTAIVFDALQKYTAFRTSWVARGMMDGFALNYITTALMVVDPHIHEHFGWWRTLSYTERIAHEDAYYDTLWGTWAGFVTQFATGE